MQHICADSDCSIISLVHDIVKNYTADYDKALIFNKVHHELNQVNVYVYIYVVKNACAKAVAQYNCCVMLPKMWTSLLCVPLFLPLPVL